MFVVGVLLADLVFIAHLGVALWTGSVARQGIEVALAEAFTYVAESSAEQVGEYVEASEQTTYTVVRWIERDSPTVDEIEDRLLMLAAADSRLRVIAVAFPDDSFVAVVPGQDGSGLAYVTARATTTEGTYRFTGYRVDLTVASVEDGELTVGGRELGFWDAAESAYELVWTQPALRPITGVGGSWAAKRVLDDEGEVQAVVATDFPLDALEADLNSLPIGKDGEIFLLDRGRRVLTGPASVSDQIASGFDEDGGLPASDFAIDPSETATPFDVTVQIGQDGSLQTAERGLTDLGVPWILHFRATDSALAPGIIHLAQVFRWMTGGMLVVLVFALVVYAIIWNPLQSLRRAAYQDGLTGLLTRRRLAVLAPGVIADAHSDGGHVCVVVLDLDNFKSLNDALGHDAGDAALESVGTALAGYARSGDLVARWGGDEFVAVLAMPDDTLGTTAMERLRASTEQALVTMYPEVAGLGVTAGGTRSLSGSDRLEDLVRAADQALIEGKQHAKSTSYAAHH